MIAARRPTSRIVIAGYGQEFMTRSLPNVEAIANTAGFRAAYPRVSLGSIDGTRAADNLQRLDILGRLGTWHRTGGYLLARSFGGASAAIQWMPGSSGTHTRIGAKRSPRPRIAAAATS